MQSLCRTLFSLLLTILAAALAVLLLLLPWTIAIGLQQSLKSIPGGMSV